MNHRFKKVLYACQITKATERASCYIHTELGTTKMLRSNYRFIQVCIQNSILRVGLETKRYGRR